MALLLSDLRWSPNGSQLIYGGPDSATGGRGGTFLISRLGGQARRLMDYTMYQASSPDGSRLAVANQNWKFVRIVSVGGETIRQVDVPDFQWINGLAWPRTADRLAILEHSDQRQFVLWSMTSEGKERRRLYADEAPLYSPQWAPTSTTLYCLRARKDDAELLAIDEDGQETNPRVLLSGLPQAPSLFSHLSISADGRSLLMLRGMASMNLSALKINWPTDALRPITSGTGSFFSPSISPDGRWVAAVSGMGSRTRIVKIPLLGGDPIPLTSGEYRDGAPAWSPDGTQIAFGSNRDGAPGVWVMNTDGQQQSHIVLGPVS